MKTNKIVLSLMIALLAVVTIRLALSLYFNDNMEMPKKMKTVNESLDLEKEAYSDIPALSAEEMAENDVVRQFEKVYSEFLANERLDYKSIEDTWKSYKNNEVISNLYYFCVSVNCMELYDILDNSKYIKQSEEWAAKINYGYEGPFSDEIIAYAKGILGDTDSEQVNKTRQQQSVFDNLTLREKAEIINYIHTRYAHYDNEVGKPTGDTYSSIIWENASDEYGISESHVDLIWIDIKAIQEYTRLFGGTSATSGSKSSDYTGKYDAVLEYSDDSVVVFISEDAMTRFLKAVAKGDEGTILEMENTGEIGVTPNGTKCNIIETKLTKYQVKLLDGPYEGRSVWVVLESLKRK